MIIDFHAHIQPGTDHGCDNIDMSKKQLLLAKQAGVDVVVSVCHFYPYKENGNGFFSRVLPLRQQLKEYVETDPSLPRVLYGSEVTLCAGLEKMQRLKELCIEGTNCILIEMPFSNWDNKLLDTLDALRYQCGLFPILAHVDRYDHREIEKLFSMDIPGQLNAQGFSSLLTRGRLLKWIKNGNIVALGSDIHKLSSEYDKFEKAVKIIGKDNLSAIMDKSRELLNL
jgi:protein-tyrosine phosphatase